MPSWRIAGAHTILTYGLTYGPAPGHWQLGAGSSMNRTAETNQDLIAMKNRAWISATRSLPTLCCALLASVPAVGSDFGAAIKSGETAFGFRYRLEQVDQDGFDKNAFASTGKARLTYTSGAFGSFNIGIEADYAMVLGIEDFNSTTNGYTQYPVIADPEGFDLNQAFLKYQREDVSVTVGRQRINHGTQRFLGGVAWRNNEQTYDALRVQRSAANVDLDYSYIHNVNRIFGPGDGAQPGDWYGNTHAARATFKPQAGHAITAFGYLIDLRNANGPGNANATYGVDYHGEFDRFTVTAVLARQSDYADNPVSYDASFFSIKGAFALEGATLTAGYDILGSDEGRLGFRTPLATLHKWQGWTDKFLGTPADGVRDAWFSVSGKVMGATVQGVFHTFKADHGGADYGSEVGVSVQRQLSDNLGLHFKLARYSADELATDTTKFWLVFDWRW